MNEPLQCRGSVPLARTQTVTLPKIESTGNGQADQLICSQMLTLDHGMKAAVAGQYIVMADIGLGVILAVAVRGGWRLLGIAMVVAGGGYGLFEFFRQASAMAQ
ncbi:hypothetical protein QFZ41_003233 [Luteibacter sp. W1I16]|uniref:hypothetical protein n=1 Tax=Luteibacter sp. W1I16 TaxID=3373922 RepID=UPI003D1CB1C9